MLRSISLAALAASVCTSVWATEQLAPVVVSANRVETPVSKVGSAIEVIEGEALERLGVTTVAEALEHVTGFSTVRAGGAGGQTSVFVRGFNQGYVKVLLDGMDIGDVSMVQPATEFGNMPLGSIERIELLKGSQSLIHGGQAVAGVVSITTRRAKGKGQSHYLNAETGSYGTLNGAYGQTLTTDSTFLSLGVQSGRATGFSAADERDGNTERDGTEYFGFHATGGVDLTETLTLEGGLRYFHRDSELDGFGLLGFGDTNDEATSDDVQLRLALRHEDGPLRQTFSLSNTNTDRVYTGGFNSNYNGNRTRLDYLGSYALNDRVEFLVGTEANLDRSLSNEGVDVRADSQLYGAFAQIGVTPITGLTLTGGVRLDHHSEFGSYPTGRLTAAYVPVAGTKLRTSFGTDFRAPSHYELFDPNYGNDALTPETSRSFDAGIEQSLMAGRINASAGVFHTELEDAIEWVFPAGYSQVAGTSVRKGIEAGLNVKITPAIDLNLGYTFTDAETRTGTPVRRVPKHSVSARVHADLTDKLALDVNARYVDGVFDPTELEPYLVVNAQLGYEFAPGTVAYLRADNLLDEKYQTVAGYGTARRSGYVGVRAKF